jgi:hypothetical protein
VPTTDHLHRRAMFGILPLGWGVACRVVRLPIVKTALLRSVGKQRMH